MHPVARAVAVIAVLACAACDKVPIVDVNAGFVLADVSWFEQEQTMFLFYQVNATDLEFLVLPWLAILAAAFLAALPAVVRAVRIDPVSMLRAD